MSVLQNAERYEQETFGMFPRLCRHSKLKLDMKSMKSGTQTRRRLSYISEGIRPFAGGGKATSKLSIAARQDRCSISAISSRESRFARTTQLPCPSLTRHCC